MPTSSTSYGEDVMQHMTAYRTLLDAGITPAAGFGLQSGSVRPADGHARHG